MHPYDQSMQLDMRKPNLALVDWFIESRGLKVAPETLLSAEDLPDPRLALGELYSPESIDKFLSDSSLGDYNADIDFRQWSNSGWRSNIDCTSFW